jgi:hypothetical protein
VAAGEAKFQVFQTFSDMLQAYCWEINFIQKTQAQTLEYERYKNI